MDSDSPRITELQSICTDHGATLLVDCAHDLGCMGDTGRGILEIQGMVGKVDVLMGSFSQVIRINRWIRGHPASRYADGNACLLWTPDIHKRDDTNPGSGCAGSTEHCHRGGRGGPPGGDWQQTSPISAVFLRRTGLSPRANRARSCRSSSATARPPVS